MRIISAGLSDIGLQREINEDNFALSPDHRLYIVADGMGGHRAGDVASRIAAESIEKFFDTTKSEDATWPFPFDPKLSFEENRLVTGIRFANKLIFEASVRDRNVQGMGTTVVGAHLAEDKTRLFIAHVGDSRAYLIRGGNIEQLTRDHSLVNDYLTMMPHLTEEEREELPKNVITRALGMQEEVNVDIGGHSIEVGDRFILCTDGLTGMVKDEEILKITLEAGDDNEAAAKALISKANENGGDDNTTVVVLQVEEDA